MLSKKYVVSIIAAVVILAIIVLGMFIWKKEVHAPVKISSSSTTTQPVVTDSTTPEQNTPPPVTKPLSTDYKLIKGISGDTAETLKTQYYDDGIIQSGDYVGYHRIIADSNSVAYNGPDSSEGRLVFATLDYKKFVVDSGSWNMGYDFFSSDVTGGADLTTNHPTVINYKDLIYDRADLDSATGNTITSIPQKSVRLNPSIYAGLQFYSSEPQTTSFVPTNTTGWSADSLDAMNIKQKYFNLDSTVYAVDSYGIIYEYILEAPKINPTANNVSTYNTYSKLLPAGCGMGYLYTLQNINDNEIKSLTTSLSGLTLYTLSDVNHPLNKAEYEAKIAIYNDPVWADSYNNGKLPTYEEYTAKNPVLIYKDAWGRLIGVGEYDNFLPGGCGKPVIYLYPTQPTKVTLQLANTSYFNVDIPNYSNGWKVLANPNGVLKDLQPQDTNCDKINYSLFGSEYAKESCKTGLYPYIYWSGNTENTFTPLVNSGWVVDKSDLKNFLNAKMSKMGFNSKESNDMISYWLPEMLAKNQPYYRISFYQTSDMNKFIPLNVSPRPDTELRMFMDWAALNEKPSTPLAPEKLVNVQRNGFTLVEWGGLQQ